MNNKISKEVEEQALKVAKATQKPKQTKEQTKLIAQGIEKGIAEYKKLAKSKQRDADKAKKKKAPVIDAEPEINISNNKSNLVKLPLKEDTTILKLEPSVDLLATLLETFLISLTISITKIETLEVYYQWANLKSLMEVRNIISHN